MTPPDFRPLDRTENGMTYGVLVPHFGEAATPKRIIEGAVLAEDIGLDAVWVRDHLLWTPHGMEGTDPTFVEPLTALAAIASRTSKVYLGTAVLIPLRWPLKLAQDLASLSYLAGGRVIALTVNNAADGSRLATLGVDGICSDEFRLLDRI